MHERGEPVQASDDDLRLAHKINTLVTEKKVAPEQAAAADPEVLDRMAEKLFDPGHVQDWFHPQTIHEKQPGNIAEDIIVDLLRDHPLITARHGTPEEDQRDKIDLVLQFSGGNERVPLQVTTDADPKHLRGKIAQLSQETILVLLPPAERILDAYERNNKRDLQMIIQDVIRQVLQAIARKWEYRGLYHRLEEQLLAA
ncbi:MAG: hypothetical protein V1907_01455 [Candidatus Kerfeldbacteria bacterium]